MGGPEEMKFANKELYTYNVIDGDYFVIDEKAQLKVLTGSPRANSMVFGSSLSPGSSGSRVRRKSSETMASQNPRSRRKSSGRTTPGRTSPNPVSPSGKSSVSRNLFGTSNNLKNPVAKNYGEFFHSKVFPEEKQGNSLLMKESNPEQ